MSKTLKWIIGILAGLAIVFLVVTVGYLVFNYVNGPTWMLETRAFRHWEGEQGFPRHFMPEDGIPLRPNRLLSGDIFPFRGFFGIFFCLGMLILLGMIVAALIIALTRTRKPATAVVANVPSPSPNEPTEMAAPSNLCPNCQRPVNEEWNHCAYCGTALNPSD